MEQNIKEELALNKANFIEDDERITFEKDQKRLFYYMLLWSIMLLIAGIVAVIITKEGLGVLDSLKTLLLSPSKLVTDYYNLGSLGSAFINAALCGFACNIMILVTKAKRSATLLAGYFLVIAHCFYGLNFLNMWLPFLSIFLYAVIAKKRLGDVLHLSMFATSLGPFISDFLFRYTLGDDFVFGSFKITLAGVIIAVVFSLCAGLLIPGLVNGVTKMHRGYNLYKAGIAIGLFGFFAFALFYKTFNISTPDTLIKDNDFYEQNKNLHYIFSILFFVVMFTISFFIGFFSNGKSFKGYKNLWNCDGWRDDFPTKFGMPLTIMNIGIYGMGILIYYVVIILVSEGTGFSGPTTGAIIAAITFSASGQTLRNVWPIALGYIIFMSVYYIIAKMVGIESINTISNQAYLSAFAFATGLCPFSGKYNWIVGTIAGIIDAVICTSTVALHGGFVLYNGGFTAGLTAILLLPVLDFYHVKARINND